VALLYGRTKKGNLISVSRSFFLHRLIFISKKGRAKVFPDPNLSEEGDEKLNNIFFIVYSDAGNIADWIIPSGYCPVDFGRIHT